MKKLFLSLMTSILLISSSYAYETKVNFETNRGGKFILYVNGQKLNYRPASYVSLDHLPAGRNRLKVKYFNNGQVCDTYETIHLRSGYETSFNISPNRYGELNVNRTHITKFYHNSYDDQSYYEPVNHYESNNRFKNFFYGFEKRRFDNKKIAFATQYLSNNYVSTRQLVKLLDGLSFDDNKVELMVYAYSHISDPENFYLAFDALRFQSSIREVKNRLGLNYSSKRKRRGRRY